eukprot:Gb_18354 [translate_table: standard]
MRTAPIPTPKASHWTIKGFEKSGVSKTSTVIITPLSCSNQFSALSFQEKAPYFVKSVKAASLDE